MPEMSGFPVPHSVEQISSLQGSKAETVRLSEVRFCNKVILISKACPRGEISALNGHFVEETVQRTVNFSLRGMDAG